jgi:AcrR family transcriptional regulator
VSGPGAAAAVTRRERQAQTRAKLLEAAVEVFARRGLERASIDEIAAEAGFTKGAFYSSFDSKDDLFLAILDERFGAEADRLEAMLVSGAEDPQGQAREAAIDFVRTVGADPQWSRLFFEFTVRAARDPDFREHLAARYEVLRERLAGIYRRWAEEFPEQPPIAFEEIATMTYCMANGFLLEQLIEPDLSDELHGSMFAIFFRGLQGLAQDRAEARG